MKKLNCSGCRERKNCRDSFVSWLFFIIGLIATVAVRVVTVLIHLDPFYAKIAWYLGVGGFFIFFVYKYKVSQARSRVIREKNLPEKIESGKALDHDDYAFLSGLFCALQSKKERVNYLFIFILSALAIVLAVYMDFLR